MSKTNCSGVVTVPAYTRGDGTEVSGYERICPYPHDDRTKKDYPTNRNLSDVKELKEILYQKGYYKPEPHSEAGGILHEYPNNNLVDAIRAFQRDNKLPATGTMNALTTDKLMEKVPKPVPKPINVKMSNDGIDLLKSFEGDIKFQKAKGYYKNGIFYIHNDGVGNPTIGYGHKLKPGESFPSGITEKQAGELLKQDVKIAEIDYIKLIGRTDYSQKKIDGILSFLYNVGGSGKVARSDTIRMLKNNIDVDPITGKTLEEELKEWVSKGTATEASLKERRDIEWEWIKS